MAPSGSANLANSLASSRALRLLLLSRFNGKLRDECLNARHFATLAEARTRIERWRLEYNTERPHLGLKQQTPAEYAARFTPEEGNPSTRHSDAAVAQTRGKVTQLLTSSLRTSSSICRIAVPQIRTACPLGQQLPAARRWRRT